VYRFKNTLLPTRCGGISAIVIWGKNVQIGERKRRKSKIERKIDER
jgi:hypothetical protein